MIVRESISESIKHLTPRSKKELKSVKPTYKFEKFVDGCQNGLLWAVKEVLKEEPDLHLNKNTYGSGFAYAAQEGHLEIIKFLAKKPILDKFYQIYAVAASTAYGHLDILKYLIEELDYKPEWAVDDSTIYFGDKKQLPMHAAALAGHIDIVKYLITYTSVKNSLNDYEKEVLAIKTNIPFEEFLNI